MAGEPSDYAINSFIEISGLPRSNAIQWLKANNNDPNAAASVWIDGGMAELPPPPARIKQDAYMEDQFHADRQGNPPQSQVEASFGKQESGVLGPGAFDGQTPSGAPTRPSSRVSNTRTKPFYGPENNPEMPRPETEEEQIQRATELSLSDSQTLPAKGSGVSYFNTFGPATRSDYDRDGWAMTIPEAHTQEILLNPDPPDRKRLAGTPAFFRPSSSSPFLPPLMKILHAIPMAREAFLNRSVLANDYGNGRDWWDGNPIRGLRVVNVGQSDHSSVASDLVHEIQRLMAFLDSSDRAYGSVDALSYPPPISKRSSDIDNFLAGWMASTQELTDSAPLSSMFTTRGTRCSKQTQTVEHTDTFNSLQVIVERDSSEKGYSLYEALDDMIWSSSPDTHAFLHHPGDIFIFEVHNPKPNIDHLGISVPAVWYVDRYLESKVEEAARMQADKIQISRQAQNIEEVQNQLMTYTRHDKGSTMDAGPLVGSVGQFLLQSKDYIDTHQDLSLDESQISSHTLGSAIEELTSVSRRVAEKLEEFDQLRGSISERILNVSAKYKAPSDDTGNSPIHKYILAGVFFNGHHFYVLESAEEDSFIEDYLSISVPGHQWWKVEYDAASSSPVRTSRVAEEEVLIAASTDGPKASLVYASERAMEVERKPLPPQLQDFVYADNLNFQKEIDEFNAQNMPGLYDSSLSPHKRKASAAADDSDLEVEYDRSEHRRSTDAFSSGRSSPFDPDPREDYEDDYPPDLASTSAHRLRPLEPNPPAPELYDDQVPGSQHQDTEMKESGQGMLRDFVGKYKLGSYTPEIDMDDDSDEKVEH